MSDTDDEEHTDARRMRNIERDLARLAEAQRVSEAIKDSETRIMGELRGVRHDITGIDKSLHGERDGKSGLVARVTALEAGAAERAAQLNAATAERLEEKRGRWQMVASMIAAAAAVGAVVVGALLATGH